MWVFFQKINTSLNQITVKIACSHRPLRIFNTSTGQLAWISLPHILCHLRHRCLQRSDRWMHLLISILLPQYGFHNLVQISFQFKEPGFCWSFSFGKSCFSGSLVINERFHDIVIVILISLVVLILVMLGVLVGSWWLLIPFVL